MTNKTNSNLHKMKNIGNLVKQYTPKPIISILYLIPVFLLLVGIIWIGVAMFKAPDAERAYYYIGMGVLAILIIVLLVGRSSAIPKHSFELYDNGIKIVYKKEKTPDEEFVLEDISEIWNFSTNGGSKANYLAFLPISGDYKVISPKFSDYRGLMQALIEKYVSVLAPVKSEALTHGERLIFPKLPEDGEKVVTSEKAIVPYLKSVQKEHLSLDRFSLFDGQKTFALTDIKSANIEKTNIVVKSIANEPIYIKSYFAVSNADLFLKLINEITTHKTENPGEVS